MLALFILGLLGHTAFALDIACKDGVEIKSQPINNIDYLVGNWSYIYHYAQTPLDPKLLEHSDDRVVACAEVEFRPITREDYDAKKALCDLGIKPGKALLKWEEARLVLNAPTLQIENSIVFEGEYGLEIMANCDELLHIVPKKVSDDIMVVSDTESHVTEMFSKKPIHLFSELKCVSQNVDVAKGMNGIDMCY